MAGTEFAAVRGMGNTALHPLIHVLWSTVVPIAIVCAVGGALVGIVLKWIERGAISAERSLRFGRAAKQAVVEDFFAVPDSPRCPWCEGEMTKRTVRKGPQAGSQFWGCSSHPRCRGTRSI